ncbi:MAG: hypothetical protein ACI9D0_000892 [Bacteroidia bacterium]|jgi:uncharacterized protein involved in cysteine biosynthesis
MSKNQSAICPCIVCGYENESGACSHCGWGSRRDLGPNVRQPVGTAGALGVGGTALLKGFGLLLGTRGIKRLLLPPFLLTLAIFIGMVNWAIGWTTSFLDTNLGSGDERLSLGTWDEGWWRSAVEWIMNEGFGLAIARGSSWIVFTFVAWAAAWYCFSIVYEAIAGPFLDEVQGKLESKWFGKDPRSTLKRPTDLAPGICARYTWSLGAGGVLLSLVLYALLPSSWFLLSALGFLVPFLAAMSPTGLPGLAHGAEYSKWLSWIRSTESRALWVGIEVAAITLFLLVLLLPLHFVPIIGTLLYSAIVGFCTAIGMLEIPMERRGWILSQRIHFLKHHLLPITLFGCTVGLVFTVPLLGPMIAVPSASIGGLWLVIRLDKSFLRRA